MNIYTSYFSNYKNLVEYQCVSIANSKPANIFVPEWVTVRPDWCNVDAYKKGLLDYEQFTKLYRAKLEQFDSCMYTAYLMQYKQDVVLLCWEKDATICHRRVLAEFLSELLNTQINELD